jgi:hypothetical protein
VKRAWVMAAAIVAAAAMTMAAAGCGGNHRRPPPPGGPDMGGIGPGACSLIGHADEDQDRDGYTANQGDCNDCNALINPGAMQIAGDPTDYACDGMPGVVASCDTGLAGRTDGASLAQAMGFCDARFLVSAQLVQPTNIQARLVVQRFGQILPKDGASMSLLSTGIAADKSMIGYTDPQTGTVLDYTNEVANPDPSVPAVPGCSMLQPPKVNDYAELLVKLRAPTNAHSFSFNFQFFSAEYPEFVCTEFNDEFLVMMESKGEFVSATNISFDDHMNPITVNNGFFTICANDTSKPQTQHCTQSVVGLTGTGYENDDGSGRPQGGSTGWLTTTAPVTPGEEVTLHFMIFDEGDHIYDSAVLIDGFTWKLDSTDGPVTIQ